MRDLTGELKERLKTAEGKIARATAEIKALEAEHRLLLGMLEIEARRVGSIDDITLPKSINEIVTESLRKGHKTKVDLVGAALAAGHEAPARGIHANLMNMERHGHVIREGGDYYAFTKKGREAYENGS